MPLTVDEIARHSLVTCRVSDDSRDIARLMLEQNVGSVLVEEGGRVVGIITKNDLLRQIISGKSLEEKAEYVMSHSVASCNKTDAISEALEKFQGHSRLVIKDEKGKVIGVVKKKIAERFARTSLAYDFVHRHRHI